MAKWNKVKPVKGKGGKQIGTRVRNNETGKELTLLNPHGKFAKATYELEHNVRLTNEGEVKLDKNGKPLQLTEVQRAYRAGYRSHVIDETKAYKSHGGKQ